MAAEAAAGSAALARLREYLEKESGFDPLITHGIIEAISSTESTREEAEEIANVYLEGEASLAHPRDHRVFPLTRPAPR